MTVVLDANVLLRIADLTSAQHPLGRAAVTALRNRGEDLRTVPQAAYEFWVVATRPTHNNGLGFAPARAAAELAAIEASFPVIRDIPAIFDRWKALVAAHGCRGKVAHDARISAALQCHGLTHLPTFNVADFGRFPGLTALDPAALPAAPPQGP